MTTDVKEEPEQKTTEQPTEDKVKTDVNTNDKLLEQMKAMFDASIKELKETFDKKTEEQDSKIKEKDEEIAKLKQANANMALTSNFSGAGNGEIDYSSKDFDEVDWSSQAKSALDKIDAKIFDLNVKSN